MSDKQSLAEVIHDDVRCGLPSASGLQRLALCPGSRQAEAAAPDRSEGAIDAMLGTKLHKFLETGETPEDESERDAVEWCRTTEHMLAESLLAYTKPFCREVRWWDRERRFSGQADVVFYNNESGNALIIDYKFGRGEVAPAGHNHQLAALALLSVDNLPRVEKCYVCLLQPYVSRVPSPRVWNMSSADSLRERIYDIIDKSTAPDAPLVPGTVQCKYCRALPTCPAAGLQIEKLKASDITAARWQQLTRAQKSRLYDFALLAKRWSECVLDATKEDLKNGLQIDGLKLGAPRRTFKISAPAEAFAKLNELFPNTVTPEAFTACCTVKMSDLDKLVHSARKTENAKTKATESKDWLRKTLEECGEFSESEPPVVKIPDKD